MGRDNECKERVKICLGVLKIKNLGRIIKKLEEILPPRPCQKVEIFQ